MIIYFSLVNSEENDAVHFEKALILKNNSAGKYFIKNTQCLEISDYDHLLFDTVSRINGKNGVFFGGEVNIEESISMSKIHSRLRCHCF